MRRPKRQDEWTPEESKNAFVAEMTKRNSVYHAAKAAHVGRSTVYAWRKEDPLFAQAWDNAIEDAVDVLEESLYQRATKHDTTAAIFILKGRRSDIYKDRQDLNVSARVVDVRFSDDARSS